MFIRQCISQLSKILRRICLKSREVLNNQWREKSIRRHQIHQLRQMSRNTVTIFFVNVYATVHRLARHYCDLCTVITRDGSFTTLSLLLVITTPAHLLRAFGTQHDKRSPTRTAVFRGTCRCEHSATGRSQRFDHSPQCGS